MTSGFPVSIRLEDTVQLYLREWVSGLPPIGATTDWYRERMRQPHALLESGTTLWNLITPKANELLSKSADQLLERAGEQRRVRRETARKCLLQAQEAHLTKAKRTGRLSEHAVIAGAMKRLAEVPRADGSYTIPICFAPAAKKSRFRIGPVAILSRAEFEQEHGDAIEKIAADSGWFGPKAVGEWSLYSKKYDHFILVDIRKHEADMAWKAARDVAEYALNLIRMRFGFYHTDDVRVGDGFVWETKRVKVRFEETGAANFSLSNGPLASHLDDGWMDHFDSDFGGEATLFGSLALWMASGDDATSPVLERLRYANTLIAEAFSEPHDRIRLVRLVASLEALAALPREQKAENLAWRCAYAGGWTDCGRAVQIVDDVSHAYRVRSAIVHGDGTSNDEAISAFYKLERHLSHIYIGFLHLYAKVQHRYRPKHIRHVREAFERHIQYFFWDPEAVW